jgi:hypothetical protein
MIINGNGSTATLPGVKGAGHVALYSRLTFIVMTNLPHNTTVTMQAVNVAVPLNFKRRSADRAVNTFHLGYKTQSVYAVSGTSAEHFI